MRSHSQTKQSALPYIMENAAPLLTWRLILRLGLQDEALLLLLLLFLRK